MCEGNGCCGEAAAERPRRDCGTELNLAPIAQARSRTRDAGTIRDAASSGKGPSRFGMQVPAARASPTLVSDVAARTARPAKRWGCQSGVSLSAAHRRPPTTAQVYEGVSAEHLHTMQGVPCAARLNRSRLSAVGIIGVTRHRLWPQPVQTTALAVGSPSHRHLCRSPYAEHAERDPVSRPRLQSHDRCSANANSATVAGDARGDGERSRRLAAPEGMG